MPTRQQSPGVCRTPKGVTIVTREPAPPARRRPTLGAQRLQHHILLTVIDLSVAALRSPHISGTVRSARCDWDVGLHGFVACSVWSITAQTAGDTWDYITRITTAGTYCASVTYCVLHGIQATGYTEPVFILWTVEQQTRSFWLSDTNITIRKERAKPRIRVHMFFTLEYTHYSVFETRLINIPVNTKHFYNIYTMLDQRRRRWADVV